MDKDELSPIEVAKRLRISSATVRRYEERNLLRPARRLLGSNHRRYDAASVAELEAIMKIPVEELRAAAMEGLRRHNQETAATTRPVTVNAASPEAVAAKLREVMSPADIAHLATLLAGR